jgi:hypothetical protein
VEEALTQRSYSGMEIHEYMNAKSAFMMKMLRISNQLTDTEIEDIRRATSSALRMAPIRFDNFMMREFVISDVDLLLQARLAPTIKEAEELAVEIIKHAGMAKRKHAELAILVRENRERDEDVQMVGRVGVRIIEDVTTIAADKTLVRVLDAMPTEAKRVGRISLLYVFFDPRRGNAAIARNALDAFVLALAETVEKKNTEHGTPISTDSETVWHLLKGSKLFKIDHSNLEEDIVFEVNGFI